MIPLSIYIHIPFCKQKCIYCDFYSVTSDKNIPVYFSALEREIDYYDKHSKKNYIVKSIYFGGGTPSIVPYHYIEKILNKLSSEFLLSDNIEISIEANPGTLSKEQLSAYRSMGINRISIGVQSFNDSDLIFLSRIHNSKDAKKIIELANKAGFDNINLDLIFNLPSQTHDDWMKNLNTAVNLPVTHISAYSLIIEEGTPLHEMVINGEVKIENDDYDSELYISTIEFLEKNSFHIYEVSNFAKDGFECIHNKAYWDYTDYLGFGVASHSFITQSLSEETCPGALAKGKKMRSWQPRELKTYLKNLNHISSAARQVELIDEKQKEEEYIMLQMRSDGLNMEEFFNVFNYRFEEKHKTLLKQSEDAGLLNVGKERIKLTPKGYSIADEIILRFL